MGRTWGKLGQWNFMAMGFKVPSNPTYSMIPSAPPGLWHLGLGLGCSDPSWAEGKGACGSLIPALAHPEGGERGFSTIPTLWLHPPPCSPAPSPAWMDFYITSLWSFSWHPNECRMKKKNLIFSILLKGKAKPKKIKMLHELWEMNTAQVNNWESFRDHSWQMLLGLIIFVFFKLFVML